jgi:transposase
MTRRRYELTDHEWSILSPLLPNKPRGVGLRQQCHPGQGGPAKGLGQHPAEDQPEGFVRFLALGLSEAESRREVLQQDQTVPRHRNPIR